MKPLLSCLVSQRQQQQEDQPSPPAARPRGFPTWAANPGVAPRCAPWEAPGGSRPDSVPPGFPAQGLCRRTGREPGNWVRVGTSALLGRRRAAEVGEDANPLPRLDPPSRLLPRRTQTLARSPTPRSTGSSARGAVRRVRTAGVRGPGLRVPSVGAQLLSSRLPLPLAVSHLLPPAHPRPRGREAPCPHRPESAQSGGWGEAPRACAEQ